MEKIKVLETDVSVYTKEQEDYICITDIARYKNADATDDLIRNWLRDRNTVDFWAFGSSCITPILNPSNSTGLESQQVLTVLHHFWD